MTSNRQVVEQYFASTGTDYAHLLADNVELIEWGDGVPATGLRTRGRAAFVENRGSRNYRPEIDRMVETGDLVLVEGTARGTTNDGHRWAVHFCDIFELEHGRVTRLSAFGASVKDDP